MTERKYVFRTMCALAALVPALNAAAQQSPVRPVRIVVPLTAASGADIAGHIGRAGCGEPEAHRNAAKRPDDTEQGLPGFEMEVWFGMWAPSATPRAVLQKLAADVRTALDSHEVHEQYAKLGIEPGTLYLDNFARFVRTEMKKYEQVVKRADIQPL